MKKLRLLLVDDQSLFREALRTLLSLQPDFEIVAEAENGERAITLAKAHRPDVVLMDLRMPVMGGVESTRRLLQAVPSARVVVLTTFDEDEEVFEALRAGANGYLLKACSADKLCESVRAAAKGASVLEPSVAARMMAEVNRAATREGRKVAPALSDPLTDRELAVLRLLAAGRSNKEIGGELGITEGTVKNHMTNVLGKLGVLDRTQAALRARELGLI
ncbi:response regulator transcription factor [Oleiharenicola lentus]|jgi:DNA-binding NarL/FixJ family response regulator|uniref:Response regulator transcription factor n=1 Tax=Oleiharenicola lentus TaxID=2508720 RepID=A0A4Q1C8M3_9BACT|nr:response regulator transcription factor [Oleiharenicola lentus]RXK55206.1 response regulator transcription factor [Oleiharenicola lentus]